MKRLAVQYDPQHLVDLVWDRDYLMWVNQGWRNATVLMTIDDEALVEYEMPNGSSALRIVPVASDQQGAISPPWYRNLSYKRVPKKWLRKLVETGMTWLGSPQQSEDYVGQPVDLLYGVS